MSKRIILPLMFAIIPASGFSMHIAEGFLPVKWCIFWTLLFIPFLFRGLKEIKKKVGENSTTKLLFAVVAAFVFVLSSLKLPSVGGSSSHLTGVALGAILFGASSMSVVGLIVLMFQALLLAHGGITTLGANAVSMAVMGPFVAVGVYNISTKLKLPQWVGVFLATFFSNLVIYTGTSFQLALAFQTEASGLTENLIKFLSVFSFTQLPLAIIEGVITIFAFQLIVKYSREELASFNPELHE
ncbi:MAG: energy-coupling factor ABC transporter permease [Bacteroidota bacterium]